MSKKIDHLDWVKKAVAKDRITATSYPALTAPRVRDGITFGGDSFRLHIVDTVLCQDASDLDDPPMTKFGEIIQDARQLPVAFAITRDDLVQAVKVAMSVHPDHNAVVLSANGALSVRATEIDNGDAGGTITHGEKTLVRWATKKTGELWREAFYLHAGQDAHIKLNGKFLLDALAGMPDTCGVLFRPQVGETPSMMRVAGMVDERLHEAIIMGLAELEESVKDLQEPEQGVENEPY